MLKSYSLVTLVWAIPGLFVIGLLLSLYSDIQWIPARTGRLGNSMGLEPAPSPVHGVGASESESRPPGR